MLALCLWQQGGLLLAPGHLVWCRREPGGGQDGGKLRGILLCQCMGVDGLDAICCLVWSSPRPLHADHATVPAPWRSPMLEWEKEYITDTGGLSNAQLGQVVNAISYFQ